MILIIHYDHYYHYTLLSLSSLGIETFLLGRELITVSIGFLISNIVQFNDGFNDWPAIINLLWVRLNLPSMIVMMLLAQLTPEVSKLAHYCAYIIDTCLPLFLYCHLSFSLSVSSDASKQAYEVLS